MKFFKGRNSLTDVERTSSPQLEDNLRQLVRAKIIELFASRQGGPKNGFSEEVVLYLNSTTSSRAMKLLSWNCRGLGHPLTVQVARSLARGNGINLLFLMETKCTVSSLSSLSFKLGFTVLIIVVWMLVVVVGVCGRRGMPLLMLWLYNFRFLILKNG